MKSTIEHPLDFFEFILNEENIISEIEKGLINSDFISYTIILPNSVEYIEQDKFGEYKDGIYPIEKILIPILRKEFNNSTELLKKAFLKNDYELNKNFITYQFNIIQSFTYNKFSIINKFPYLIFPLRGIVKYINDRLLTTQENPYVLNENKIEYTSSFEHDIINKKSDIELIHEVFEYMQGKNEKGEQILDQQDYELLFQYITFLIIEENIPKISKKLKPNLNKATLGFSFWVLHNELYTTKRIREYFYDFMKGVFVNFENDSIDYISNQIGTKSRVPHNKFLPKIIKNHLDIKA